MTQLPIQYSLGFAAVAAVAASASVGICDGLHQPAAIGDAATSAIACATGIIFTAKWANTVKAADVKAAIARKRPMTAIAAIALLPGLILGWLCPESGFLGAFLLAGVMDLVGAWLPYFWIPLSKGGFSRSDTTTMANAAN